LSGEDQPLIGDDLADADFALAFTLSYLSHDSVRLLSIDLSTLYSRRSVLKNAARRQ
jgi:hypothetical protein